MPANGTIYITQHSCSYWSMASAPFYPRWTALVCVIIQGVQIGWNPCGEWNDLPSEAGISSYCKTRLFDRSHALEFIQVKAGLSLWKPAELSWDPVEKSQNLNTKTKSYHECHPRTMHSSHILPSGGCSCMHMKRILFQGHTSVSLERNESERAKSQWSLQAEAKLTRRGNHHENTGE